MTRRFLLAAFLLGVLPGSHAATPPAARTFADVEVAVTRMQAEWQRSQLTAHPQGSLITRDRRFELFYGLPMSERAVVVMDSFAGAELDGELAFMMGQMLLYRSHPGAARTKDDRLYTTALFRVIENYPTARVKRFCWYDADRYARFRRNLRRWKWYCQRSS